MSDDKIKEIAKLRERFDQLVRAGLVGRWMLMQLQALIEKTEFKNIFSQSDLNSLINNINETIKIMEEALEIKR